MYCVGDAEGLLNRASASSSSSLSSSSKTPAEVRRQHSTRARAKEDEPIDFSSYTFVLRIETAMG